MRNSLYNPIPERAESEPAPPAAVLPPRKSLFRSFKSTVEHTPTQSRAAVLALYGSVGVCTILYAVFFSWLSLQRYDAFLMHALDMGNMDQAVWNTLHGHPFYFTNMRVPLPKEAWGTTTRLSFHVEPILLPLSLLYLIHSGPETLLITQAVVVSLGAPAAARLALRVTGSVFFAFAAAVGYLLAPSVQAATLYEFHPVTLVAALLLWVIVFAEERRLIEFIVFSILAIACKEEIGLIVAALCAWMWWRGCHLRLLIVSGIVAAGWSLVAVGLIVPHFAQGSSAYWQRYINAGAETGRTSSGLRGLLRYWLAHPTEPFLTMIWAPKLAMLHRWLISMGYLGLLGWPLLLVSLPSLGIILLSTDQHMYGGLAQYSAELVPLGVAAGIYGAAWLIQRFGQRPDRARILASACAIWLLVLSLSNERFNGFSPIAANYVAPAITDHDLLGDRLLALIPPGAPVSAMDQLNPHLGDRPGIYLFPDTVGADYVALDVTTNVNPGSASQVHHAALQLLESRHWLILAAEQGYLILKRTPKLLASVPVIPSTFFQFGLPGRDTQAPIAIFGDSLQLLSVQIQRREQVNLRIPDVVLVTRWRVLRPLPATLQVEFQATNTHNVVVDRYDDQPLIDWLSPTRWAVGQIVQMQSRQISLVDLDPGNVHMRIMVSTGSESGQDRAFTPRLLGDERAPSTAVVKDALEVAVLHLVF